MSEAVLHRLLRLAMIATVAAATASAGDDQDVSWEASVFSEGKPHAAPTVNQRAKLQQAEWRNHHGHHNRAKMATQHHANQDAHIAKATGSLGHRHRKRSHQERSRERSLVRRSVKTAEAVEDHAVLESPGRKATAASSAAVPEGADAKAFPDMTGRLRWESFESLNTCSRLMVGTWWFHGGSNFREFRIFREVDGSLYFRQVWGTFPYRRLGRLQQLRSEVARPTKSGHVSTACAFQGNLTDGDQIHIYYHFANSRIPETIEVAAAHNLLQPVLASRRPSPWMSPTNSAIFIAAALMFSSLLTACWPCCGSPTTHHASKKGSTRKQQGERPATAGGTQDQQPPGTAKICEPTGAAMSCGEAPVASEGRGSLQASRRVTSNSLSATQELKKQPERVREEWLDSLRLTCIMFMVIRHALQSVERLGRLPPQLDANFLAFFLHGLPIFLYIAGHSCGTSMPSQGSTFTDQLCYLRRRAVRLLIPDLLGAVLVVMPTEYIGREWRPCANMGQRDGFMDWLRAYVFKSGTRAGWHCEGLGWLGFLITLFCVQAMLYPWAAALHHQILLRADQAKTTWASSIKGLCYPMLWQCWLAVWLSCIGAAVELDGDMPLPLRGVLRPDVALVCAPLLADTVMVQFAPLGAASHSAGWRYYFWLSAVLRRVVASVALATFTLRTTFDKSQMHSNNSSTLWVELLCFAIFYQQGVVDGVLKTAAAREQAEGEDACAEHKPGFRPGVLPFSAPLETMLSKTWMQKMHRWNPQKNGRVMAAVCWGLWLLLSLLPVPGMMIYGAGFRYPAYRRSSAGHFILRSWAILGIAIWWWSNHLPEVFRRMSGFAELGFSFYFLHWLFIESAMLEIYGKPAWPLPRGDMPWWAGLFLSLLACCFGVLLCHALLVLLIRGGLRCYRSHNEFVIAVKTSM
mmetsp:Transcript_102507/g.187300  ORF Transcript_102507/g.187300 Transcript_102507/m.187300 type:complete len:917 (-) Transcript_102507:57-2807(-)